jgi:hypothetical protein
MIPADRVTVISGAGGERPPLSAVTPDAVALARNEIVAAALMHRAESEPGVSGAKKKQTD